MTAVDNGVVDLRIWVASAPLPALRLPQSGQDVWLLGRMLEVAVGAPGDEGVEPATGLGRILYESRPRSAAIIATLLSGFSAAIAILALTAAIALRLTALAVLAAGTGMGAIMLGSTARVRSTHRRASSQRACKRYSRTSPCAAAGAVAAPLSSARSACA